MCFILGGRQGFRIRRKLIETTFFIRPEFLGIRFNFFR